MEAKRREVTKLISDLYYGNDPDKKRKILIVLAEYGDYIERKRFNEAVLELEKSDEEFKNKYQVSDELIKDLKKLGEI